LSKEVVIYTDGASRGNPGKAGIGAVIFNSNNEVLREIAEYIGESTNNVAEYKAVIAGLKAGLSLGAKNVRLKADSQLLIRQIQGVYKVKNAGLKPLYKEVLDLLSQYDSYQVEHVPREENSLADKLANDGIDKNN